MQGGACRHAGPNPRPSFSSKEDERPTTQGEEAGMDQQITFHSAILSPNKGGEKKKRAPTPPPSSLHHKVTIFCESNCVLVQLGGGTPGCCRRNLSDPGAKSHESGRNMRQNADLRIINIYIYLKPGRIGFFEAGLLV